MRSASSAQEWREKRKVTSGKGEKRKSWWDSWHSRAELKRGLIVGRDPHPLSFQGRRNSRGGWVIALELEPNKCQTPNTVDRAPHSDVRYWLIKCLVMLKISLDGPIFGLVSYWLIKCLVMLKISLDGPIFGLVSLHSQVPGANNYLLHLQNASRCLSTLIRCLDTHAEHA
jgi:hypothetical protein